METDQVQIQNLIRWFRNSKFGNQSQRQLSPVPCQKRSLEEVQTSLGVVSNVTVRVTNIETVSLGTADTKSPKKRRFSPSPSAKISVVTVSDGRHNLMPLLLRCGHAFQGILEAALSKGTPVLLNRVVCRKARKVSWWSEENPSNEEAKVLVATSSTDVVSVPRRQLQLSSQPVLTETQQSQLTRTQQQQTQQQQQANQTQAFGNATQQEQSIHNSVVQQQSITTTTLEAPLVGMEFPSLGATIGNRVGSKNSKVHVPNPTKLLSILTHYGDEGQIYREATLLLSAPSPPAAKTNYTTASSLLPSSNNNRKDALVRVHADADAMKNLCAGIAANELKQRPRLLSHVRDWLQAILDEEISLRWRVCSGQTEGTGNDWEYRLEKVTLIRL